MPADEGRYYLDTDASYGSIGAVLSQIQQGQERVIAYASRTLNTPEQNYCVTRKELLAIVYYMKEFRQYLLGREFHGPNGPRRSAMVDADANAHRAAGAVVGYLGRVRFRRPTPAGALPRERRRFVAPPKRERRRSQPRERDPAAVRGPIGDAAEIEGHGWSNGGFGRPRDPTRSWPRCAVG